jgi:hypothetical protein
LREVILDSTASEEGIKAFFMSFLAAGAIAILPDAPNHLASPSMTAFIRMRLLEGAHEKSNCSSGVRRFSHCGLFRILVPQCS